MLSFFEENVYCDAKKSLIIEKTPVLYIGNCTIYFNVKLYFKLAPGLITNFDVDCLRIYFRKIMKNLTHPFLSVGLFTRTLLWNYSNIPNDLRSQIDKI